MNYKHNIGFFTKTDMPKYIGIALVLLGVILFYFGWGYICYIILCISLPLGIGLFIFGSSRRSSESDLDTCISLSLRDLDPKPDSDKRFEKKLDTRIPPMTAEGYEYKDGVMIAKGKDGIIRTNEYTASIIYTLNESLYIIKRSFSLTEDKTVDTTVTIPLCKIIDIELERESVTISFMGKQYTAPKCTLIIKLADSGCFSTPIKDNILTDEYTEKLKAKLKKYKASIIDNSDN